MFGTGLGGLLHGVGFTLGVSLSTYESCDGDGGSLAIPLKNIGEAGIREGVCTKCPGDFNIFYIAVISYESWIYMMVVESTRMG